MRCLLDSADPRPGASLLIYKKFHMSRLRNRLALAAILASSACAAFAAAPDAPKADAKGAGHKEVFEPEASTSNGTVKIGGQPAARATDKCDCKGPTDTIAKGSATVKIGGLMAARQGDSTAHGGVIAAGCPTVQIGG